MILYLITIVHILTTFRTLFVMYSFDGRLITIASTTSSIHSLQYYAFGTWGVFSKRFACYVQRIRMSEVICWVRTIWKRPSNACFQLCIQFGKQNIVKSNLEIMIFKNKLWVHSALFLFSELFHNTTTPIAHWVIEE